MLLACVKSIVKKTISRAAAAAACQEHALTATRLIHLHTCATSDERGNFLRFTKEGKAATHGQKEISVPCSHVV